MSSKQTKMPLRSRQTPSQLTYAQKLKIAEAKAEKYRRKCIEVWDPYGFPEEDLPETLPLDFSVWTPEPHLESSLPLSKNTDRRLQAEMRLSLHDAVDEWIQPFEFTDKYPPLDVEKILSSCGVELGWSGCFHFGKQLVRGQKHFLSLAEDKTYAHLWVDWAPVAIGIPQMMTPNTGGVRVPIAFTGLEARLMVGRPLTFSPYAKSQHPKFPRDRYRLVTGSRRNPVLKLMPV